MKFPPRRTHPAPPLYFPPQPTTTVPPPEIIDQISQNVSVGFPQVTGTIANAQTPLAAIMQWITNILASAALTGVPTTPTATVGTNTTQVASTAFVIANAGGGGGSPARADVAVTTAALADQAVETGTIALGKSAMVVRIVSSHQCRIRLHSTAAYRTADAGRLAGTDPLGLHGVMLEVQLLYGQLTWEASPLIKVTNDDLPAVANIYYSIQNMSGVSAAVTVTFTRIPLET